MSFRVQLTNDQVKTPEQLAEEERLRNLSNKPTSPPKYVYKKGKDGKMHKYRVKKKSSKNKAQTLPAPITASNPESGPRIHTISTLNTAADWY